MTVPGYAAGTGPLYTTRFRLSRKPASPKTGSRNVVLAVSNGALYYRAGSGRFVQVGGSLSLATDRNIRMAQHSSLAYIADWGEIVAEGTDGVRGTGDTKFDAASVADWTAVSPTIDTDDMVIVISNPTDSDITAGTYTISTVASGELTLGADFSNSGATTCTWRIIRCPKVYNPVANTLTKWTATTGEVPSGCPLVATFMERLVLAGQAWAPQVWFMSRQGDPLDFDFSQTDAQGAVGGPSSTNANAGEPITCLASVGDDYLVIGTRNQVFVMAGDPKLGGTLRNKSRSEGVIGPDAWCVGPSNEFYYLSSHGLFVLPPGAAQPQNISGDVLPNELRRLGYDDVTLCYDTANDGIYILVTSDLFGAAGRTNWYYDVRMQSFWKDSFPATFKPRRTMNFEGEVLVGCNDGWVRSFDEDFDTDDGTTIPSYVNTGAMRLSQMKGAWEGMFQRLDCVLDVDSADVTWEIYTSDTAQGAVDAAIAATSPNDTGTFSAGRDYPEYPRVRGVYGVIRLSCSARRPWAFEGMDATTLHAGAYRKP